MLQERYSPDFLREHLYKTDSWIPWPTIEDRESWERLPSVLRSGCVHAAEELLEEPWPTATASGSPASGSSVR